MTFKDFEGFNRNEIPYKTAAGCRNNFVMVGDRNTCSIGAAILRRP